MLLLFFLCLTSNFDTTLSATTSPWPMTMTTDRFNMYTTTNGAETTATTTATTPIGTTPPTGTTPPIGTTTAPTTATTPPTTATTPIGTTPPTGTPTPTTIGMTTAPTTATTTSTPTTDISPDPHVSQSLTSTFTTDGALSMDCSEKYVAAFEGSHLAVVADINDLLNNYDMCTFTEGMIVVGGNIILNEQGLTVTIRFHTWMLPASSQKMADVESCSFEVKKHLENVSNWPNPIIPYIEDCPTNYMDPQSFQDNGTEWKVTQQ